MKMSSYFYLAVPALALISVVACQSRNGAPPAKISQPRTVAGNNAPATGDRNDGLGPCPSIQGTYENSATGMPIQMFIRSARGGSLSVQMSYWSDALVSNGKSTKFSDGSMWSAVCKSGTVDIIGVDAVGARYHTVIKPSPTGVEAANLNPNNPRETSFVLDFTPAVNAAAPAKPVEARGTVIDSAGGNYQGTITVLDHDKLNKLWTDDSCLHDGVVHSYGECMDREYHPRCKLIEAELTPLPSTGGSLSARVVIDRDMTGKTMKFYFADGGQGATLFCSSGSQSEWTVEQLQSIFGSLAYVSVSR